MATLTRNHQNWAVQPNWINHSSTHSSPGMCPSPSSLTPSLWPLPMLSKSSLWSRPGSSIVFPFPEPFRWREFIPPLKSQKNLISTSVCPFVYPHSRIYRRPFAPDSSHHSFCRSMWTHSLVSITWERAPWGQVCIWFIFVAHKTFLVWTWLPNHHYFPLFLFSNRIPMLCGNPPHPGRS